MAKGFNDLEGIAKEYGIGGNKSEFYAPEEGENRIRIVSGFEPLAKHWANGKMLGICFGKEKGCPICNAEPEYGEDGQEKSRKPAVKFLMYIIDRKDGKVKIAEFGWSIIDGMRALSQSEEYGFEGLPPYDMILTKTVKNGGKNPSDTSYTIVGARQNSELNVNEMDEISQLTDIEEVVRRMKAKAGADEDAEAEAEANVEEIDPADIPFDPEPTNQ